MQSLSSEASAYYVRIDYLLNENSGYNATTDYYPGQKTDVVTFNLSGKRNYWNKDRPVNCIIRPALS